MRPASHFEFETPVLKCHFTYVHIKAHSPDWQFISLITDLGQNQVAIEIHIYNIAFPIFLIIM